MIHLLFLLVFPSSLLDEPLLDDEKMLIPWSMEGSSCFSSTINLGGGIPAGGQVIKNAGKRKWKKKTVWSLEATIDLGKTIPDRFGYSLHDVVVSFLDEKTLFPVMVMKKIQEGDYKRLVSIRYNYKSKKGTYIKHHVNRETGAKGDIDKKKKFSWSEDHPIHNTISLLYWLRTLDLPHLARTKEPVKFFFLDEKRLEVEKATVKVHSKIIQIKDKSRPIFHVIQTSKNEEINEIEVIIAATAQRKILKINAGALKVKIPTLFKPIAYQLGIKDGVISATSIAKPCHKK